MSAMRASDDLSEWTVSPLSNQLKSAKAFLPKLGQQPTCPARYNKAKHDGCLMVYCNYFERAAVVSLPFIIQQLSI